MTKIYILERNRVPFYVGKTLQEIKERFHTHGIKKENSEIIEVKQGPYAGDEDKVKFQPEKNISTNIKN